MTLVINQPEKNIFTTKARANEFTIKIKPNNTWAVTVINPMVRAYRGGVAFPTDFANLQAVEERYKSLKGIALILSDIVWQEA